MRHFDSKKAQTFIFVIVAIVILVIVGLVSLIVSNTKTQQSIAQAKKETTEALSNSIPSMIQTCLDSSARSAIYLAGQQGGYIFKSQGGLTPDDYSIFGVHVANLKVSGLEYGGAYWILEPDNVETSTYGIFTFPYLSHSELLPSFKTITVQDNLQSYVLNDFQKCFDLEKVKSEFKNANVHLVGMPSVSVDFNKKNVVFTLNYPLSAYDHQYTSFTSTVNVPFSSMYKSAECFVNNDIHNLTFDVNSFNSVCHPLKGISLTPYAEVGNRNNAGYSVMMVNSTLQDPNMNKPVVLYFLRQNRHPVLINLTKCAKLNGHLITSNSITVKAGDEFDLTGCAFDPDEDNLVVSVNNLLYPLDFKVDNKLCKSGQTSKWKISAYDHLVYSHPQTLEVKCS